MTISKILITYATALISFLLIDLVWLGLVAKNLYFNSLGDIVDLKVNWIYALTFYSIYIIGLLIFAIFPAIEAKDFMKALTNGALFGFFTYMTYEMTNAATINNWPTKIIFIDIVWGSVLCAMVSGITYYFMNSIG